MVEEEIPYEKMIDAVKRVVASEPKIESNRSFWNGSVSTYGKIEYEYDDKKVRKQAYQGCWSDDEIK